MTEVICTDPIILEIAINTALYRQSAKYPQTQQAGFSVLSVLVAVAVTSLLIYATSSFIITSSNTALHMQQRYDLASTREWIMQELDCTKTVAALGGTCSSGVPIDVKSIQQRNPFLIRKDTGGGYSKVFGYSLQATCEPCGSVTGCTHKIAVKYALFTKSGSFATDPITKKVLDWNNGIDLFNGIPIACKIPF